MKKLLLIGVASVLLAACTTNTGSLGNRDGGDTSVQMNGKIVGGISHTSSKVTTSR